MHGWGFYGIGGFEWIWVIVNLAIIVAVIVAIVLFVVWLVRRLTASNHATGPAYSSAVEDAKSIAKRRYAQGEISREEYQQIIADIQ
jgi:putative membrane protein